MSLRESPPRFALDWLERAAPRHLRDSVMGDLEEEWRARVARGPLRAAIWFSFHAARLSLRLSWFDFTHKQLRDGGHPPRKGDGFMETLWNDARFGARMLARTPGFTIVAVLTLALGIGANAAIFSIVNTLMIKPLPLPDSERLVSILSADSSGRQQFLSFPDFEDLQKQTKVFEGFSAMVPQSVNLTGRPEPTRVRGGFVSDNFFTLLGVSVSEGRAFQPGDDVIGAPNVVVLQHEAWQTTFSGDPAIVGKSIVLNNQPFTVVGILPRGFRFPFDETEVWMPHHTWPPFSAGNSYQKRLNGLVAPIGKLRVGTSLSTGQAELDTIGARLSAQYPEAGPGRSIRATPLRDSVISNVRQMVLVLMGAVVFVLLIACANVANLMLARASARQAEIATRAALGAGRGRLVKQMLTEAALLWMAGGVLGVVLGYLGLQALMASAPAPLPGGLVPTLDWTVIAFTFAISAFTGVLFGASAALRFSRPNLTEMLKEGARSGSGRARVRMSGALVVSQVALTLVMLAGSALMLRSFQKLTQVDVGFRPDNLLTLEYRLPANKYPDGAVQWETHRQIVERVRAVPGVKSASVVRAVPFGGNGTTIQYRIPGTAEIPLQDLPRLVLNFPDPYYFETMGIPLLRGRGLAQTDIAEAPPVVVISKRFADRAWPNQDPIGRNVEFPTAQPPVTATVIGVVGDVKHYSLSEADRPQAYAPQAQQPNIFNSLVVRTEGEPTSYTNAVRSAIWSVDADQPMWKIYTMDFMIQRSLGQPAFMMRLMVVYALIGLLLAAVGLYGVMAYAVAQRSTEIGVRMALGAQSGDVLGLILRRGARLTVAGLVLGGVAAFALGGSVRSLLFGVQPTDPAALSTAAFVLLGVALLASYIPARRATKANPVSILHRS